MVFVLLLVGAMAKQSLGGYIFDGGFPTPETIELAYFDADLNRAIQAYRFFYPAVSIAATWKANVAAGVVPNRVFGLLRGNPRQRVLTPSSDTPYAGILLDVRDGPIRIELPPGPLICVVNDLNQRFVMDLGVPGPDAGKGGKHLIVPPGYQGIVPDGHFAGRPTTNRVLLMMRVIPPTVTSMPASR